MPHPSRRIWLCSTFTGLAILAASIQIAGYWHDAHPQTVQLNARSPRQFVPWPPNYTEIEPGLWMGGYVDHPPPHTQAVLNLCESKDPFQADVHVWNAIHDGGPAPSLPWLEQQVDFIESQRRAGHVVYVHCHGGVSRSGMVMAAYLMRHEGWSVALALDYLRAKRPAVSPNPAFMPLLAEWERANAAGATARKRAG